MSDRFAGIDTPIVTPFADGDERGLLGNAAFAPAREVCIGRARTLQRRLMPLQPRATDVLCQQLAARVALSETHAASH